MPFLLNNPEEFVDQATEGFIAANGHLVRQVHGGVVRNQEKQAGQVAVVIGGGSGHYPAFAGVVGPGLAHGAVMGNVFASPSAQRVLSVCKSVEAGSGVLLSYGNYAGDVMNFNLAQEELIAEGIPCKTVLVTDDIMSADKSEIHKRRGIAGDLVVFKIAAAAAEAGYSLDEVYKVGERANERTRTIGVAFSGCTLPGKNEPLFTVPEGRMALGLGIHGEPGLSESDIPTSKDLANDLVERLINETPASVDSQFPIRLTVLVNGLGGVKYEELFIFYRDVSENLRKRGIEIVEPEVGELVTSFEMAGASLTFTWLDNELEELWKKPAYTAAYKKGTLTFKTQVINQKSSELAEAKIVPGTAESQQCAKTIARILEKIDIKCREVSEELGKLDAIAGDGDHGIGMTKGAWSDNAGGTSGIIWGIILKEFGSAFGDQTSPKIETINNAIVQATRAVTSFGKAQLGDKTLVDVLIPFSKKFEELSRESSTQDISLSKIWQDASDTARNAANATANLVPKIGRARPHAEKSVGHSDPGAESLAIIIAEISSFFKGNHHG
jgi:dihydroxyacetone kinase